jgi:hypothetical protein
MLGRYLTARSDLEILGREASSATTFSPRTKPTEPLNERFYDQQSPQELYAVKRMSASAASPNRHISQTLPTDKEATL